jgi:hypothetical protein
MFKILIVTVLETDNVTGPMLEFLHAKSEPAELGDVDLILVISLISDFKKLPEKTKRQFMETKHSVQCHFLDEKAAEHV